MDVSGFKKTFFDRAAVADKIPPAIKKALSRFGFFVRQTAKKSLKYGDKPSKPGQPPTVHRSAKFLRKKKVKGKVKLQGSSPLRELIFFGYEATDKSVVIGPAIGGSKSGAPHIQEYGGNGIIESRGRRVSVRFPSRPYMQPAFDKQLAAVNNDFRNLVTR